MAMILLKDYAERLGKNHVVVLQKAARGTFRTARKIGVQWFIDENEPYADARLKSGAYVGVKRARQPGGKQRKPE